jgi:hypothetical protein
MPKALLGLGELRRLFLHGNEQLQLPREILGPTRDEAGLSGVTPASPRAILEYYFATRGAEGVAMREMNLIVVGRGGAGKTSLIKRLKGEPFDPARERDARHQHPRTGTGLPGWAGAGAGVGLRRAARTPCHARVLPHRAQPLPAGAWRTRRHGRECISITGGESQHQRPRFPSRKRARL